MKAFITQFIQGLDPEFTAVSYSPNKIPMNSIRTTFGVYPFGQEVMKMGCLIFIDLCTIANWSHPCTYIFYISEEEFYGANENWMPHKDIALLPFTISD